MNNLFDYYKKKTSSVLWKWLNKHHQTMQIQQMLYKFMHKPITYNAYNLEEYGSANHMDNINTFEIP